MRAMNNLGHWRLGHEKATKTSPIWLYGVKFEFDVSRLNARNPHM